MARRRTTTKRGGRAGRKTAVKRASPASRPRRPTLARRSSKVAKPMAPTTHHMVLRSRRPPAEQLLTLEKVALTQPKPRRRPRKPRALIKSTAPAAHREREVVTDVGSQRQRELHAAVPSVAPATTRSDGTAVASSESGIVLALPSSSPLAPAAASSIASPPSNEALVQLSVAEASSGDMPFAIDEPTPLVEQEWQQEPPSTPPSLPSRSAGWPPSASSHTARAASPESTADRPHSTPHRGRPMSAAPEAAAIRNAPHDKHVTFSPDVVAAHQTTSAELSVATAPSPAETDSADAAQAAARVDAQVRHDARLAIEHAAAACSLPSPNSSRKSPITMQIQAVEKLRLAAAGAVRQLTYA